MWEFLNPIEERVDTFRYHYVPKNHKGYKQHAASCDCCTKCWVYVEGPMIGKCEFGGPYDGWK